MEPGDFININRVNGSGHAVNFINYIDISGNKVAKHDSTVVGFKYYSSQGHSAKGEGGMSYRWAFFDKFGCPEIPYKRPGYRGLLNSRKVDKPNSESLKFFHKPAQFNGLTTDD